MDNKKVLELLSQIDEMIVNLKKWKQELDFIFKGIVEANVKLVIINDKLRKELYLNEKEKQKRHRETE